MIKLSVVLLILSLSFTGCASMDYLDDPYKSLPAFYQVNDDLYRGGRPDMAGLVELEEKGIKTIVSFREDDETTRIEKEMASAIGIRKFYIIPLGLDRTPSDEEVLEFLEIVTNEDNFPVFVHCDSGRDRTAAMIAMYRVVVESWTIKEAYKEAKSLGFWPYHYDAQLKKFIHQLKDKDIYFRKVGRQPPLP